MRQSDTALLIAAAVLGLTSSGCRAVEMVFKAGVWTGILALVLLIAAVLGVTRLVRRARSAG
jgi:hypothetical protein